MEIVNCNQGKDLLALPLQGATPGQIKTKATSIRRRIVGLQPCSHWNDGPHSVSAGPPDVLATQKPMWAIHCDSDKRMAADEDMNAPIPTEQGLLLQGMRSNPGVCRKKRTLKEALSNKPVQRVQSLMCLA